MSLDEIVDEVLRHLFDGYIENGGTPIFPVGEIIVSHGESPTEVGRYMVERGWVKHERFGPNHFAATISMHGINKIKPDWLNGYVNRIISILGTNGGGRQSLMDLLEFESKDFQIAFDLAKALERMDLIKPQFTHMDIIVELTLVGRDFYDTNKASFL